MQTLYIKSCNDIDFKDNFFNKALVYFKRKLGILDIKNIDNKIICNIPYKDNISEKQAKKLCRKFLLYSQLKKEHKKEYKIYKIIGNKYYISKVVLSKNLKENEILKNEINNYDVELLDGRWLFKHLTIKVLEYICKIEKSLLQEKNVSILINNSNNINLNLIVLIATKVKRLSIITNDFSKFKYIEEKLYEDYGIAIEVANNKKKSLLKTDIIVNVDFDEELLNKYKINRLAVLVNLNKKITIYTKAFNGINVNYYNIDCKNIDLFKENDLYNYFDKEILYESYIYRKDNLNNILSQIDSDKVEITNLIGLRGKINYNEFIVNSIDKIEKLS